MVRGYHFRFVSTMQGYCALSSTERENWWSKAMLVADRGVAQWSMFVMAGINKWRRLGMRPDTLEL